jgi:endonuclease/exonuclease/phosphatase family metal-dependent hydrolase
MFNSFNNRESHDRASPFVARPPAVLHKSIRLKLVTFNVHDIRLVSCYRQGRMRAIGKLLTDIQPDLVGIQEAFVSADREILVGQLRNTRLKYYKYFPSGLVGSGLWILSAFPIQETHFHRFPMNGKLYKIWHGDWWAGKGIALARVRLPDNNGFLDLFNTHIHARYDHGQSVDEYSKDRRHQLGEVTRFIRTLEIKTIPSIILGDFNSTVTDEDHRVAVTATDLESLSVIDTRIDHIYARRNPHYQFHVSGSEEIVETVGIYGKKVPLSDHSAFISRVEINKPDLNTQDI